jgi:uroporphyrin-3 C-methyltransferase
MSEDTKVEETAEAVADDSVVEEPVVEEPVTEETLVEDPDPASGEPESAVPPDPGSRAESRRGTSPVSWLALFLSFITLAAVGYMIMEDRRTRDAAETSSDSIAQLSGRIDESRQSLSDLDQHLADLASSDENMQSHVQSLQQSIEERGQLLDSLPGRMSNLENSVSALQGVSAGARDTWLLAEAEYYMQIANAQLQLGNNPHLAMLALAMADERVVQMANPALTDVRRAIADELAELEVMQKPDIEGTTLTLASLSRVVESLPMSSVDQATVEDVEATDEELGATARAWESVKGAMSGLVRVTPPDEETRALLTPDTAQLVRSNLALQLQAARLALLRGEQAIFEQSLDDADALLTEYFDAGSAQVIGAKETLAEIRDSMVAVAPPDISESLRLLRQFRTLSENGQ